MVSKRGYFTYLEMGYMGVNNPPILTIDPNFQRDIQVGSMGLKYSLIYEWIADFYGKWVVNKHII